MEAGKQITALTEGSLGKLLEALAELFAAPGRDGETMIYGIIIRPSEFDAGRNTQSSSRSTQGHRISSYQTLVEEHELAELGLIVVQIDGTGTNWRSKAFHDRCYKEPQRCRPTRSDCMDNGCLGVEAMDGYQQSRDLR